MAIVRCISCDGYGWFNDEISGQAEDCDWCGGIGYVYRDENQTDRPIPAADLKQPAISDQLEALEIERLREMGYTGEAKKPWQQAIREGTRGGENPYAADDPTGDA